jgi:hypothetical protein
VRETIGFTDARGAGSMEAISALVNPKPFSSKIISV